MHVGILTLHLSIEGADSLKDKRQVIRSLVQKLRNHFNISAAEVGDLNLWRRAVVGVVAVSNDSRFVNQILSQVVNHVESDGRAGLEDYTLEILAAGAVETTLADAAPEVDVSDWFPS